VKALSFVTAIDDPSRFWRSKARQGADMGLALARRSCHRKPTVAVARKLAVIMHAMWTDGTCYVGDAADTPAIAQHAPPARMANCWEPRHERAPDTSDAAFRHSDGSKLTMERRDGG
jgi:hypothetical protein